MEDLRSGAQTEERYPDWHEGPGLSERSEHVNQAGFVRNEHVNKGGYGEGWCESEAWGEGTPSAGGARGRP